MKSGKSTLQSHRGCATLTLTIPATVVHDSTFPFKAGEEVDVEIHDISHDPSEPLNVLMITKGMTKPQRYQRHKPVRETTKK